MSGFVPECGPDGMSVFISSDGEIAVVAMDAEEAWKIFEEEIGEKREDYPGITWVQQEPYTWIKADYSKAPRDIPPHFERSVGQLVFTRDAGEWSCFHGPGIIDQYVASKRRGCSWIYTKRQLG